MKNVGMLAPALFVIIGTLGFAQEEPPLEPIPMPAPVAKAAAAEDASPATTIDAVSHEEVVMPLDGPVFPDNSVIVDQTPVEPIELETVIESPTQAAAPRPSAAPPATNYVAPRANSSNVVRGPVSRAPSLTQPAVYAGEVVVTPDGRRVAPAPQAYAVPGQPMVYEQSTYRSSYRPGRRRIYERASYQQTTYPPGTGVAVYRTVPSGVVEMRQVRPANYAVQVQVPVRTVGPYAVYGTGYAPAYGLPIAPMAAPPYALPPVPYVPGQPMRNAIRSMFW